MKISENFDRWMFDYKEGNLSPKEVEEFESFLIQNPEFDIDADAWDMAYVPNEPVIYPHMEKLEKKRRVAGWYWSAAALILLLFGTTTLYIFSDDSLSEGAMQGQSTFFNENRTGNFADQTGSFYSSTHRTNALFDKLSWINNGSLQSNATYIDNHNPAGNNGSHFNEGVNQNLNLSTGTLNSFSDVHNDDRKDQAGSAQSSLVAMESGKVEGQNNVGVYSNNPDSKSLNFDVSQKGGINSKRSSGALRKVYHRIERLLGYPVGLTNLRDPDILMPQSSVVAFNPSFAGGMLKSRFEMNYRNQWLGSDQNSSELNISYDTYSYNLRGGVGVLLNAQDYGYGKFGDYNLSLLYSPKLVLGRNIVIEPSVKMTMGTLMANGDQLTPGSSFEMDRGRTLNTLSADKMSGITQQWYKDFGMGVMVNTKWFYAGFSADNLAQHYENVYGNELSSPAKTPVKLSGVIGTDYLAKGRNMSYSPFVAYQQIGTRSEIWGGMNYRLGNMLLGGSVSTSKEFTASIGMKFDKFKLVYRYDHTESMLTGERMGSHNIGIRFNTKDKNQRLTH